MVFGLHFSGAGLDPVKSNTNGKYKVKFVREIGSGSYAKVYHAIRFQPSSNEEEVKENYAAKVINLKSAPRDFIDKFLPRELEICSKLDHRNVVKTHDIIQQPTKTILLMDYASKGDLLAHCRLVGAMPDSMSRPIFIQIVLGIEYLHDLDIIHRDLKCENILLCHDGRALVADLGFARTLGVNQTSTTYCGSAAYAAPELLKGKPYCGMVSDIWSMGCILFVMVCHIMPFRDDTITVLKQEQKLPPRYPRAIEKKINPMLRDTIKTMLEYDRGSRPTIKLVKTQRWLRG